jgi:hypothetical protein
MLWSGVREKVISRPKSRSFFIYIMIHHRPEYLPVTEVLRVPVRAVPPPREGCFLDEAPPVARDTKPL